MYFFGAKKWQIKKKKEVTILGKNVTGENVDVGILKLSAIVMVMLLCIKKWTRAQPHTESFQCNVRWQCQQIQFYEHLLRANVSNECCERDIPTMTQKHVYRELVSLVLANDQCCHSQKNFFFYFSLEIAFKGAKSG